MAEAGSQRTLWGLIKAPTDCYTAPRSDLSRAAGSSSDTQQARLVAILSAASMPMPITDPTIVGLTYASFFSIVRDKVHYFSRFVHDNSLEIEWWSKQEEDICFVSTERVIDWLLNPPHSMPWILVGKILRYPLESEVLQHPMKLASVFDAVFSGLRPIWERTQRLAAEAR